MLKANMGWQPTLQVLHGLKDLFDPEYLTDPRLATVVPANAIEWYRSPQGQSFHNILAPDLLSKDARDPSEQWKQAQAALGPPILRDKNYSIPASSQPIASADHPR